jgi:hypothetical protein
MHSKVFFDSNIFDILEPLYVKSFYNNRWNITWPDFIAELDIGLLVYRLDANIFIVTDEKKWLLSKIKYGL